ncbi:MAG: glycoside hydrolase family 52 protein [Promethearchaeota archaeon]
MKITEKNKLNLLNSRWGSRLTLNLNFLEKSIETGNLGMDFSYRKKVKYSKQNLQQLKFFVKSGSSGEEGFYFSKLNSYLANQELIAGLTYIKCVGVHSSELKIEITIRSPFSIAQSLDEDEKIKILTAPFFYIEISIENFSSIIQKIDSFIGLDLEEKYHSHFKDIYYIDRGTNNIGKREKLLALRDLQPEETKYYIDKWNKFKGFSTTKEVKPAEKVELKFIYAGFTGDYIFLNKLNEKSPYKLKFYYTKFFSKIDDILNYAEINYKDILREAHYFENLLLSYDASLEKKTIIALAFRTFLANSWLLISEAGEPEYYVWEGEIAMNSTVDIAMEVELLAKLNPWTLKLQLNEWKKYITINEKNGFFYLKHDMGSDQEVGFSFYEEIARRKFGRTEKFLPMPVEENANFSILLYWYYFITKDKEFIEEIYPTAFKLSMANKKRGYRKSGFAYKNAATTYNQSKSLHLSPLNTYLGIKECIAYIMCRELSKILEENENAEILQKEAEKILDSLVYTYEKYSYIPISLDTNYKGWDQKTIATSDPLFYVAMTGLKDPIIDKIIELLSKNFDNTYYKCTTNLYGIRFIENEEITWFSKIAIIDAVSNLLYNIPIDSTNYAYEWNKDNPMAYCDSAPFSKKKGWSGQKCPRGVSLMWEIIYNYKIKKD